MKKVLILLGLALAAMTLLGSVSGCATTIHLPDGTTRRVYLPQVSVVVRVVNNTCAGLALETVRGGRVYKGLLPPGESTPVVLVSEPFTGSSRRMPLIAKGYNTAGQYVGSVIREFYVNTYEGTHDEVWEVNYLRLPGGRQGGCR